MKHYLLLFAIAVQLFRLQGQSIEPAAYVNPLIGTGGHGHTYPGVQLPFGMLQISPDTRLSGWDGCSGYHYSDSLLYGFSHTHLSGTGVPDYCDVLLIPTTGPVKWQQEQYASGFSHLREKASAGLYQVVLDKYDIYAELTATPRVGLHRYTFPAQGQANVIIDLKHRDPVIESRIRVINNQEIRGMRRSKAWAENQVVYFVIRFSQPFGKAILAVNDKDQEGEGEANGENVKACVRFGNPASKPLIIKVALSAVSEEGAVRNLELETSDWDFDAVAAAARSSWNRELKKISVEGGNEDDFIKFYTALYHSMLCPNLYMDTDSSYLGRDFKVHKAKGFNYYTVFSLWDTYRAAHPLFTLLDEKRTNDFIQTFLHQYKEGGLLPVWELSANETFCMIGYHAVPVIADAFIKGIRGYDPGLALEAMMYSSQTDLYGLPWYRQYGYIPGDLEHESVSKTLEYAYDDWCIAQVAKAMGRQKEYGDYLVRAQSFKNLFDPGTGFMRPKINGGWLSPFDPAEVNNHYTEANSWQYSFYVPQDISGLASLLGSRQKLAGRLDSLFSASDKMSGRNQADISGLIGQYAHGNEPSHHMAYLYNYVGQAWKTQEKVHQIVKEFYKNQPDGLIGNEDCGQMSAWLVFSAMGFYPVCPGQNEYAIGTPLFGKTTLHQENGADFIIKAEQLSPQNCFIQSATWNGTKYDRCFITHEMIRKGGTLEFIMGPKPNKNWGSTDYDIPKTRIHESLIMPVPYMSTSARTFKDSLLIQLKDVMPDATIYYTTNGKEPDQNSPLYSRPLLVKENSTIKARAYSKSLGFSRTTEARYLLIPSGRSVSLNSSYENQYTAGGPDGLIDGIRGTTNWRLGNWQGYLNTDIEAVVDLGKMQEVKKISVGFLQDVNSWIWFPKEVSIAVSEDGKNFKTLKTLRPEVADTDYVIQIKEFSTEWQGEARFVRIKALKYGKIPSWHPGAGEDSHLFVDEISIE